MPYRSPRSGEKIARVERERGPIEKRLHELIRVKGLRTPWMVRYQVEGTEPNPVERDNQRDVMDMVLMEAILELAREVDDLKGSL